MADRLWFVTDGVGIVSVFDNRDSAEEELAKYQDDPDYDYYSHYSIKFNEIEDYPEEYDLALEEGFLD